MQSGPLQLTDLKATGLSHNTGMHTTHIGEIPVKHLFLVKRRHCTARQHRTSYS